jgi:hypothetical protein
MKGSISQINTWLKWSPTEWIKYEIEYQNLMTR